MNLSFKVSKPNYENNSNENNRLYCFTSVTLTFLNLIWYSFRRYSLEAQMGVIKNFKTKLALYQYLSVYCPNAGKYGAEKLRIRTVFAQDYFVFFFFFILNISLHYHKAIQCFANRIRRILSVIPTKNGSNLLYCFLHIFNNVRH